MVLSTNEIQWLVAFLLELSAVGIWALLSRRNITWFTPPIFYGIVIGYYVLGGILFFCAVDRQY